MVFLSDKYNDYNYPYVDVLDENETNVLTDKIALNSDGKSVAHVLLEGQDEKVKGGKVEMFLVYGVGYTDELSLGVKYVMSNKMEMSWLLSEDILLNLKGEKVSLYYKYTLNDVTQLIGHDTDRFEENAFYLNIKMHPLYDMFVTGAMDHFQLAKSAYIYQFTDFDNRVRRWHSVTRGGCSHLAISENDELYGWGFNSVGNLGLPTASGVEHPALCNFGENGLHPKNIVMASTGYYYSLALDRDGYLYGAGNHARGCLGDNKGEVNTSYFEKIDKRRYKAIAASSLFQEDYRGYVSYAVDIHGDLYRCGWSEYNTHLSSVEGYEAITTMTKVDTKILSTQKWKSIVHNKYMAAAINTNDQVYVWGGAWQGCLGDGRIDLKVTIPHQMDFNGYYPKIKKVVLGGHHALALDYEGNIWGWGYNERYVLAQEKDKIVIPPTKITLPGKIKCLDIATDLYATAVVTTDGKIYAWGDSKYGNLGLGQEERKIAVPTQVPFEDKAEAVEMGYWSMLVLSTKKI